MPPKEDPALLVRAGDRVGDRDDEVPELPHFGVRRVRAQEVGRLADRGLGALGERRAVAERLGIEPGR